MVGLTQEIIEKFSTPIIKVLKSNKGKDMRHELHVKCYTICNIADRDILLKQLRKYGDDVNVTDWNHLTLYEVKGVDSFDLEKLISFLKKTLTLN